MPKSRTRGALLHSGATAGACCRGCVKYVEAGDESSTASSVGALVEAAPLHNSFAMLVDESSDALANDGGLLCGTLLVAGDADGFRRCCGVNDFRGCCACESDARLTSVEGSTPASNAFCNSAEKLRLLGLKADGDAFVGDFGGDLTLALNV